MDAVSAEAAYILVWVLVTAIPVAGGTAFLIWGLRNKQFSMPEHTARLPLQSPPIRPEAADRKRKRDERT